MDSMSLGTIKFLIDWVPTILFFLIIIAGIIRGFVRGKRKSLRYFKRAFIIFAILFILYLLLCETTIGDSFILAVLNLVFGGDFAGYLGIHGDYKTLSQVLADYIPKLVEQQGIINISGIADVLNENGGYIISLVNFTYHIVFGIVFYSIYFVIEFICWLVDLFFDSNSKAMKKQNKAFMDGKAFSTYRKQSVSGALIEGLRSLITALIILSFVGSLFFIVSGDNGKGTMKERHFNDATVSTGYKLYSYVDSYGSHGIYKFLNYFTVNDGEPVYLAVPDLLFSGRVTTVKSGEYNYEFNIRKQVAPYVRYAKEIVNVVLEDDDLDINRVISGDSSYIVSFYYDKLVNEPAIQGDLLALVESFPSNTYAVNLAVDVINSSLKTLDLKSLAMGAGMTEMLIDPIMIVFSEGYYSKYIPEEIEISKLAAKDRKTLPYISLDNLASLNDITAVLTSIFDYINTSGNIELPTSTENVADYLPYVNIVIDCLENLTFFDNENSKELNPVLSRLYYYGDAVLDDLLNANESKALVRRRATMTMDEYINSLKTDVNWIGEIKNVFDSIKDIVSIYELYSSYISSVGEGATLENTLNYFFKDHKEETYTALDNLAKIFYDSNIIAKVLETDLLQEKLIEVLNSDSLFKGQFVMPEFSFINTYKADGTIKERGELYYIFKAILSLTNEENIESIINVINSKDSENFMQVVLTSIGPVLESKDKDGFTIIDYLSESKLLRSFFTSLVTTTDGIKDYVYLTDSVFETDENGNAINIIKLSEFKELLSSVVSLASDEDIMDTVSDVMNGGSDEILSSVITLLQNETLLELLNSKIIQGSIGKILYTSLGSQEGLPIIIPNFYSDPEEWIATDNENSEIISLINAFNALGLSADDLNNLGDNPLVILKAFEGNNRDSVMNTLLESDIIYYTLSNIFPSLIGQMSTGDFSLAIPNIVKESAPVGESIPYLVKKSELINLINAIFSLGIITDEGISENIDFNKLIGSVLVNKEDILASYIVTTGVVSALNTMLKDYLTDELKNAANNLSTFNSNSVWYSELDNILNVLKEAFYPVTKDNPPTLTDEDGNFDPDSIISKVESLLGRLDSESNVVKGRTVLDILFSSQIVTKLTTDTIDNVLDDSIIDTEVRELAKSKGVYKTEELKSVLSYMISLGVTFEPEVSIPDFETILIPGIPDLYSSNNFYLIRGILTKAVTSSLDDYEILDNCYETYANVFTKNELSVILGFIEGKKIDDFDPYSIEVDTVINGIYDPANGQCKSYFLLKVISDALMENSSSFGKIPLSVTRENKSYIVNDEIYYMLTSIKTLIPGIKTIDDLTDGEKISHLSDNLTLERSFFQSKIINALILRNLSLGEGINIYIDSDSIIVEEDTNGGSVALLSSTEYNALLTSVGLVGNGKSLALNISWEKFKDMDPNNKSIFLKSSIIRHLISSLISSNTDLEEAIALYNAQATLFGKPTYDKESEYVGRVRVDKRIEFEWVDFYKESDILSIASLGQ